MIDESHEPWGEAITLAQENFSKELERIFKKQKWEKATVYFEFWGENSFAGNHEDESHFLTLLDVAPHKKGILHPTEFIKLFGHLRIPEVLHHGKFGVALENKVKAGELEGMTFEGVVCKGKGKGKMLMPSMFKVKNRAWIHKLRTFCGDDEKKFNSLM